jgi:maltodextrin utilization protein YvdJ
MKVFSFFGNELHILISMVIYVTLLTLVQVFLLLLIATLFLRKTKKERIAFFGLFDAGYFLGL